MAAYEDLQVSPEANETAAQFIRNKIKEAVNDIERRRVTLAEKPIWL